MLKGLSSEMEKKEIIFYQDKASCHGAGTVQDFLKEELPAFVLNDKIPPNSPDLNPLDYCIWDMLKEAPCRHGLISNFRKLKHSLMKEWKLNRQEAIEASIDVCMAHVQWVEQESGENIKYFLLFSSSRVFLLFFNLFCFAGINHLWYNKSDSLAFKKYCRTR